MHWSEKYKPEEIDEVIGNGTAIAAMQKWAKSWKKGARPLLLHGPPGSGKTTAVQALANTMDWELLETNASDQRDKETIEKVIGIAAVSTTFSGKQRAILIDEVDGLVGTNDKGGASAIVKLMKESACPILLTANDIYDPSLIGVRFESEQVKFQRLHYQSIAKVLEHVCKQEGVKADKDALDIIAQSNHGDLKSAINDLQAVGEGKKKLMKGDLKAINSRDREGDVFNSLNTMFKTVSYSEAANITNQLTLDHDMLMRWIEENIPREYETSEDIAAAMDMLSKADIFDSRIIRRQDWSLLAYASELMTAGVSLAKKQPYRKFTRYQFPEVIKYLSASKAERGKKKEICLKVGKLCHVSWRTAAKDFMPFLEEMMQKKPEEYSAQFGFEEGEIEYLTGFDEARCKKIRKSADELVKKAVSDAYFGKQKGLAGYF